MLKILARAEPKWIVKNFGLSQAIKIPVRAKRAKTSSHSILARTKSSQQITGLAVPNTDQWAMLSQQSKIRLEPSQNELARGLFHPYTFLIRKFINLWKILWKSSKQKCAKNLSKIFFKIIKYIVKNLLKKLQKIWFKNCRNFFAFFYNFCTIFSTIFTLYSTLTKRKEQQSWSTY